jgi:CHAD domain-containing protein
LQVRVAPHETELKLRIDASAMRRIATEKLRYATEFFGPLFPAKRVKAFVKALAALQEALGAVNDATVATAIAARLSGPNSPAAALVAGWARARVDADTKALRRAWRGLREARTFWD